MAAVSSLLALLLAATPAVATTALPDADPLPSSRLDQLRGGFDLPGGGTVTLGVITTTRVDGQEVLRTVFNVRAGAPVVTVLARAAGSAGGVLSPVATSAGGVTTAAGTVTLVSMPGGTRVELAGDRLDVSHLIGGAFGSVVANAADNRAIDVATTVNISLGGVSREAIGSSGAAVDRLALDATSRLIH